MPFLLALQSDLANGKFQSKDATIANAPSDISGLSENHFCKRRSYKVSFRKTWSAEKNSRQNCHAWTAIMSGSC